MKTKLDNMTSRGRGMVQLTNESQLLPMQLWQTKDKRVACMLKNQLRWIEWNASKGHWTEN